MCRALALSRAAPVRVNVIAPGLTDAPMVTVCPATSTAVLPAVPLGTLVTPEEVAALAVHLMSDDARSITGAIMPIDGGRTGLTAIDTSGPSGRATTAVVEGLDEGGHALLLEHAGDVVEVDADLGELLPRPLGVGDALVGGASVPVLLERLDRRSGSVFTVSGPMSVST